jgi:hypothetical protein
VPFDSDLLTFTSIALILGIEAAANLLRRVGPPRAETSSSVRQGERQLFQLWIGYRIIYMEILLVPKKSISGGH